MTLTLVSELETRIASHPAFLAAKSHFHGSPGEVFTENRSVVDKSKLATETKASILRALGPEESLSLLLDQTSAAKPEPLAGHGLPYVFMFHPKTHELLASEIGHWRS